MDSALESIFNFYIFTTGRRLFGLRQVRMLAQQQAFTELVELCDQAVTHDLATREIERRWAGEPATADTNPVAQRIDVLADRTLSAIRDHILAQTQGAAAGEPIHAEAAALVKRLFPVSVYAVTSLRYIEELAVIDDIVGLLKGELAPAVKEFGLGRLVKRLADLAKQYREALETPPQSLIEWGRVRAARSEGQGLLLEAVALIVGKHHKRTPQGTEERLSLLAPILKQNEEIGQYLRSRRAVADVNPETGEDEPGAPGGTQGPGDGKGEGQAELRVALAQRQEAPALVCRRPPRYVQSMAIKRITLRIPETTARRIKKAAGDKAVSAWVTALIDERLDDAELERQWDEFYRAVNPGPNDIQRADAAFERLTRPSRRKRVA